MTREITAEISADFRITLPSGDVQQATIGEAVEQADDHAEGSPDVPPLPTTDTDESSSATELNGSNAGGGVDEVLAELPPELLELGMDSEPSATELPPPSVEYLEAMVAATDVGLDALPPEVVQLEALIEADSADMLPPDVADFEPPKRSSRAPKKK